MKRIIKVRRLLKKNKRWLPVLAAAIVGLTAAGVLAGTQIINSSRSKLQVTECTGNLAEDFKCWRTRYQELVNGDSPMAAIDDARKNFESSQYIRTNCHQLAHVIGRTAGKKFKDVSTAYTKGDDWCASGYYHGVMQAVADEIGAASITKKIDEICKPLEKLAIYGLKHYNCVHGLGHGVMAIHNNELFKSLEVCRILSGEWQQDSCYSGVFMENVIAEIDPDHHTEYLKADDPLYPCTAVDEEYRRVCYFVQTDHALIVEKADFKKVFDLCLGLEKAEYSVSCYQSLGRNSSSYARYNPEITKDTCLLGASTKAQENCFIGATNDFVWYFHGDSQVTEMCGLLSGSLRDACTKSANDYNALL
ncbi:MAG TPA: hypothetical protein VI336_02650 [Candidatus Saccharimonadales bacterium]|nr:hypothetical protein [Candidatus Saccharimonadales bacterium]